MPKYDARYKASPGAGNVTAATVWPADTVADPAAHSPTAAASNINDSLLAGRRTATRTSRVTRRAKKTTIITTRANRIPAPFPGLGRANATPAPSGATSQDAGRSPRTAPRPTAPAAHRSLTIARPGRRANHAVRRPLERATRSAVVTSLLPCAPPRGACARQPRATEGPSVRRPRRPGG